jgi:hypothetical protein
MGFAATRFRTTPLRRLAVAGVVLDAKDHRSQE